MRGFDYDIGVIGGGAAGLTVASGAARLGAKTLLLEKQPVLGGDCLHYGCVPSKTLIHTAHVYHLMKNAQACGLPQIDVPPVDFKQVAGRIRSVIEAIQKHDSPERFCQLGAQVEFGSAQFADEHTVVQNSQRYTARKWVIATGSGPIIPPIAGLAETPYLTNQDIFYLDRLPASMIILGAGPIGIEIAQAFNRLGTKVQVVDRAAQILIKEDKDLAQELMAVLAAEGVQFHLDATITSVTESGEEKQVNITDNQGKQIRLRAETVLVAVGRAANIQNLGLQAAGVTADRSGIQVDRRLRTSQKHIYAAGDVSGRFQFTHAAGYQGGIVVSNAVFHLPRKADYTYMPWCTYSDPELAGIGMNESAALQAGIKFQVWTEAFKDNDRSLAENQSIGRIKLIVDRKEKPLGVQILGPRAGDLIGEWVAALNGKVKPSTLAGAIHPYPTLVEINKKVTGSIFAPKIFSPRVQKGLRFFFNLKGRS